MALNDLTNQNIQDTYQKVVQTDGTNLADGTGSLLPIKFNESKQSVEGLKISHESIGEAEIGTSFMVGPGLHVEGHIIATGDIISQRYVVSSSVTHITTQEISGSTQFGDSADDTHDFTGNITASGGISSSGTIIANKLESDYLISHAGDANTGLQFVSDTVQIEGNNVTIAQFNTTRINLNKQITGSGGMMLEQLDITGPITASGAISCSGVFTTEQINGDIGEATGLEIAGYFSGSGATGTGSFMSSLYSQGTILANTTVTATTDVLVGANIQHLGDTTNEISFASATQDFRTNNSSRLDISNSGVRLGGTGAIVTSITDDDALGTSDTLLCTQGNVKAYADTKLSLAGGTMTGQLNFNSQNAINVDINSGTIDGTDVTVGSGKTLDVSAGTLTTSAAQKKAIVEGVGADTDIGAYELRAATFESDVLTGTAPLTVASTTVVTNLNADKLDGADLVDEDDMASDSATKVPTQQSIKAYVDQSNQGISVNGTNGLEIGGNFVVSADKNDLIESFTQNSTGYISSSANLRAPKLGLGETNITHQSSDLHIRNTDSVTVTLDSFTNNGNQTIEFINSQEPDFKIYNKHTKQGFRIASDNKDIMIFGEDERDDVQIESNVTCSVNISASGNVYSNNEHYISTTGRLVVADNTTNYFGPNPQGPNYYYWSRDLGTSATTITAKTNTLNSGFKLPHKAILTGYHLNIQGRSTNDNIEFTLVYCDGMWDGNVTSLSQTLVATEAGQTITIAAANNFYELDRRDQFSIPVDAMTMLYPRFRKTSTTAGTTNYDFQLAIQYRIVK